jgi:hypothetical protein
MSSIREQLWQDPMPMIAGALYEYVPDPSQDLHREGHGLGTFLIADKTPHVALTDQQLSRGAPPVDGGPEKGSPPSA